MNRQIIIQSQLLATKLSMPAIPHKLIARSHLMALLQKSLNYPLTLVSAPAGFGKTTLLVAWTQSPPASQFPVAWVSLDKEDNDLHLFWSYVLSALATQDPQHLTHVFKYLQSPQPPPLKQVLTMLTNLLTDSPLQYVLILDDYHVISEPHIHTTLSYLIECSPSQLHIVLSTRTDPPLLLEQLRVRQRLLEVRADQLRCSPKEVKTFFRQVMGLRFSEEIIQRVTACTEGWLVGLQLLGHSLSKQTGTTTLLEEVSGEQRYILDYLTEVVLEQQTQEVQNFLLCTSILEQFTASLCDVVTQQLNSQQMLKRIEQANLFIVSLDSKRQSYRYHTLFAGALRYRLEQRYADLVPALHYRASCWYAQHNQTIEAILHAFKAHEWQWAADLIEHQCPQLLTYTWGASDHQLETLRDWLGQLPMAILRSRPRLCLACGYLLSMVAPYPMLEAWFDTAEADLTTSLSTQTPEVTSQPMQTQLEEQERRDLLTEVIMWHATLQSLWEDYGPKAISLCQRALALVSPENALAHARIAFTQLVASYVSSVNDAVAAVESGLQVNALAQAGDLPAPLAITFMASTVGFMIGAGRLHEAQRLIQQAMQLGRKPEGSLLSEVGGLALFQAEILREWNQLEAAHARVEEALSLCQQSETIALLPSVLCGYAVLLRVFLSYGELHAAHAALQKLEHISTRMSQPVSLHFRSFFTIVDQIRLWLACGELEHATRWAEELDLRERHGTPFAREREEVARVRVLLAQTKPDVALQRLEPLLQRATTGQRWSHVIEIRLLQALAHQMNQQEMLALNALSEAVRQAEPEGYLRIFLDEGGPMKILLSRLWQERHQAGPTPYLDTLLAAFSQQGTMHKHKRHPQKNLIS